MLNLANSTTEPKLRVNPPLALAHAAHLAYSVASSRIMSTRSAKLDFPLTIAKSTTSNFLIDNFCTFLRSPASKSTSLGGSSALDPSLACPERSRRITCLPRAESRGHLPALTKEGSLLLIANDTHSREVSSHCKISTYKILIANEFHSQNLPHHPNQRALRSPNFAVSSKAREKLGGGRNG